MKMFLTRLGFNSRMVITGDITQIDLPNNVISGLIALKSPVLLMIGLKFILEKRCSKTSFSSKNSKCL